MQPRGFDDFDAYAKAYRDIHTRNIAISGADSYYFAQMRVQMLTSFETNKPIKVLDVGCGDGVSEIYMEQLFPQWNITGIDVSAESIAVARQLPLSSTRFLHYDGTSFPFSDEAFDIVFVAGVFHHIDFSLHDALVSEIRRVLKAGGRLYIFEHNPLNPLTRYLVNTCVFDKDSKLLPRNYAAAMIKRNGLQLHRFDFIIFFPRTKIFKPLLLLEKWMKRIPLGGKYFIRAIKH